MFNNDIFEDWLDTKAKEIVSDMGSGKSLSTEEMMVLVLKAQSNHFEHLDIELKNDMKQLREDMTSDMKQLREDMTQEIISVRTDMDKRFEQVIGRMDKLMIWSLGLTITSTFFIMGFIYKFAN